MTFKLALVGLLGALSLQSFAVVLVDQPTFDPDGDYSGAISANGTQFPGYSLGDNFTIASQSQITQIQFWGSSDNFENADLTNFESFEIDILDSNFNSVSTNIVATSTLNATPTGATNFSDGIEYLFTFNTNTNLAAGDYYLHVGSVNTDPQGDAWRWSFADTFDDASIINFSGGDGWEPTTGDQAFRISGDPVPEPASLAVIGIGIVTLLRRRRTR